MSMKDTMTQMNDLTNNSLQQMTALGELNMKFAERMLTHQMDLMGRAMEQSTRFMRAASEARGYSDLYKVQMDLTKDASEQMMAESKASLQMATEARDAYRAWYESALTEMRKSTGISETSANA